MRLLLLVALMGLLTSPALAGFVTVGDPGNVCDPQPQGCFGAVSYIFEVDEFEVTNEDYAIFLTAVADFDPNSLYHASMTGISRAGPSGAYTYTAAVSRRDRAVDFVSTWDAMRYANWLHNGKPSGSQSPSTTEDGAYTMDAQDILDNKVRRNEFALYALPSQDEWHKAAYFDGANYFDNPASSDDAMVCGNVSATAGASNCDGVENHITDVGSYTGSQSPVGAYDMGGNVWDWTETIGPDHDRRIWKGGGWFFGPEWALASAQHGGAPTSEFGSIGFRVVKLPMAVEVPALLPVPVYILVSLLIIAGLLALRENEGKEQ